MKLGNIRRLFLCLVTVLVFVGCGETPQNGQGGEHLAKNATGLIQDGGRASKGQITLIQVREKLYRSQITGVYYFRFAHLPVGSAPEARFVPLRSVDGDLITDVNEGTLKVMFGYYVDDKYVFQLTNQHGLYAVRTLPIDSISKGCYYDGSDYRATSGSVQYYHGRGVMECSPDEIGVLEYHLPESAVFHVLDVRECDCAILNGEILVDGCPLTESIMQDDTLYAEVMNAVKEERFKPEYCY